MELTQPGRMGRVLQSLAHLALGGVLYGALEILWRGYTHPSMVLAGGVGLALLMRLSRSRLAFVLQCVCGAALLTGIELAAGCVVNLWLGLAVWDYSDMAGHLWGQICPLYVKLWALLCIPVLPGCRLLGRWEARLMRRHSERGASAPEAAGSVQSVQNSPS